MATSVPQVSYVTLNYLRYKLGEVTENALVYARQTGDIAPLEKAVSLVRRVYESEMKEAANLGKMDRNFLEQHRIALEKMENSLVSIKRKREKA